MHNSIKQNIKNDGDRQCFLYLDTCHDEDLVFTLAWADKQMMGGLPGARQEQVLVDVRDA